MADEKTFLKDLEEFAKKYAETIALAIDDKGVIAEKVAKKVGEYVAEKYPSRTRTAYWVTVDDAKTKDKGLEIAIFRKDVGWFKNLRASALIGRETWGGGVFADVWEGKVQSRAVVASIGIGGVKAYSGGEWAPVLAVSVKW